MIAFVRTPVSPSVMIMIVAASSGSRGADGNGKPADPYRYNPPSEASDDKVTDSAVPQPGKEPESPAVIVVPVAVTPQAPTKASPQEDEDEDEDESDDSDYVPSDEDKGDDSDSETDMEGSDSDPEDTLQESLAAIDEDEEDEEEDA